MPERRNAKGAQRRRARQSARGLDALAVRSYVAQLDDAIARNAAERAVANGRGLADLSSRDRGALVHRIISAHARHHRRDGVEIDKLTRCEASRHEALGGQSLGPEGKVIYNDMGHAQAAADALAAAGLGLVYPYPCGRSTSGHAHLTSTPPSQWSPRERGLAAAALRQLGAS
jgi:hypothetical protein